MISLASNNLKKLHDSMVRGSVGRRALYAMLRGLTNRRSMGVRRRLAGDVAGAPAVGISREAGFCIFPPGRFSAADAVIDHACKLVSNRASNKSDRNFLDHKLLNRDSPYLELALRPEIINGVARYLGAIPVLATMGVWYSHPADADPSGARLFHCDWDAPTQMKVFVFCSDVAMSSGPLTLIRADTSGLARRQLKYKFRCRVQDAPMSAVVPPANWQSVVGPAGTVAFADTSRCFHFGSRTLPDGTARIAAVFQYVLPTAFNLPLDFRTALPFAHLAEAGMSDTARLVLGGE